MTMMDPGRPEAAGRGRVFHGWRMALLAALVMTVATVLLFDAVSVWAMPVLEEFRWRSVQLGLALTLARLAGVAEPLVGYMTDRFAPRRVVLTGICVLAAGFALFGLIQSLWSFYAAFLIMVAGSLMCGFIPLTVLVSRWFVRRRATAIAVLTTAPTLGAIGLVPAVAWGMSAAEWREIVFVMAGVVLITVLPVLALLRNRPEDMELLPYGVPPAVQPVSLSIAQSLRTPAFWLIALGDALAAVAIQAGTTFMGPVMTARGFDTTHTGSIILAYAGASIVFGLASGYLGDRMSKRVALGVCTLVQAVGLMVLIFANIPAMFLVFAVLFGAGSGGRGVLAVAILPDYFGTDSLGKILGFSAIFAHVLLLISFLFNGLVWDGTGSFVIPSLILTALSLLGALFFLMARSPQPPDDGGQL